MATATDNAILQAALEYASYGWRVVPAFGKKPVIREWQRIATSDEDGVCKLWEKYLDANVGVQLGPVSGIVDIEFDTAEGRATADRVFSGVITPAYGSDRSTHRIFQHSKRLPGKSKINRYGLEFRIGSKVNADGTYKGIQSIFPPSRHPSGKLYHWLPGLSPSEVQPAEIPDEVIALLWNDEEGRAFEEPSGDNKPKEWRRIFEQEFLQQGVDHQHDALLSFACREAGRSPNIDDPAEQADLYAKLEMVSRAKFRPEASEDTIRKIHQDAIEYTRKDRGGKGEQEAAFTVHGLVFKDGIWRPGEWSLKVIDSDPKEYVLSVPRWAPLMQDKSGNIRLSISEYRDPSKVAAAVQQMTGTVVLDDTPGIWPAIWNGLKGNKQEHTPPRRGLKAVLTDLAEHIDPPPTAKRYVVVAELFQEKLDAIKVTDNPQPNPKRPVRMPDGTIWFRWQQFWRELVLNREVTTQEIGELRDRIKIRKGDYKLFAPDGGKRTRYCVLQPIHQERLASIIGDQGEDKRLPSTQDEDYE